MICFVLDNYNCVQNCKSFAGTLRLYACLPPTNNCPRCLSVCLSVSKITQKRVHGFEWNFVCRQVSGHGWTDQLLSPIQIIVQMSEPENLKSKVGQRSHLTQSRLQVTECTVERYFLLHVLVQGPGSFSGRLNFLVRRTVAELRGVKLTQFSDFGLLSNTPRIRIGAARRCSDAWF